MDMYNGIIERRSIRKFKDQIVDRDLMNEIMEAARFAPSWCNYQVARYHFIETQEIIQKIGNDGVSGFIYNTKVLKNARNVLVLTYVKGKSGKIVEMGVDSGKNDWEIFDAGIACQNFCLAAHSKGIGTVIMGVIDDKVISEIINLPENESVAALIVYGYPEGDHPKATDRKSIEEITRYL